MSAHANFTLEQNHRKVGTRPHPIMNHDAAGHMMEIISPSTKDNYHTESKEAG